MLLFPVNRPVHRRTKNPTVNWNAKVICLISAAVTAFSLCNTHTYITCNGYIELTSAKQAMDTFLHFLSFGGNSLNVCQWNCFKRVFEQLENNKSINWAAPLTEVLGKTKFPLYRPFPANWIIKN